MAAVFFVVFLAGFALIGVASALKSRGTISDYYLASQSVPPWLAALSAVATNNSGYMFIGMIGLTYSVGLSSIWLMVGWIVGDLLGSLWTLSSLRRAADRPDVSTYPQLLAFWQDEPQKRLQTVAALLLVFCLTIYAAAQLKAGGKALHGVLGWPLEMGAIVGAAIVLIYSFSGGIRASIWTDAAQSFVMLGAMLMMLIVGIKNVGGWVSLGDSLNRLDAAYMDPFGGSPLWLALLTILGWLFAGLAVLGQPHIMVRYMALRNSHGFTAVRLWYYGWFAFFYAATIGVGMLTRVLLPEATGFDAELALPRLAVQLLPAPLVGFVLAGLFAATMSTADSIVLSCSSAVALDLSRGAPSLKRAKIATAVVVVIALAIAVSGGQTVFQLVLDAWGLLGAAFAPLLLLLAAKRRMNEARTLAILMAGVLIFVTWSASDLAALSYAVFPAIAGGCLFGWLISSRSDDGILRYAGTR